MSLNPQALSFREGEALAFDPVALHYELPEGIRAVEASGETLDSWPDDNYVFDHWELGGEALSITYQARNLGVPYDETKPIRTLTAYFRPAGSTKMEGSGTVSSACDYVGSSVTPTGAVATPASGEYFLGWYFSDGTLATSSDTIVADDLNDWLSHDLIREGGHPYREVRRGL